MTVQHTRSMKPLYFYCIETETDDIVPAYQQCDCRGFTVKIVKMQSRTVVR